MSMNRQSTSMVLEYLKLFRLQTGATTAVAPVIGYLLLAAQVNAQVKVFEIFVIFIIAAENSS